MTHGDDRRLTTRVFGADTYISDIINAINGGRNVLKHHMVCNYVVADDIEKIVYNQVWRGGLIVRSSRGRTFLHRHDIRTPGKLFAHTHACVPVSQS